MLKPTAGRIHVDGIDIVELVEVTVPRLPESPLRSAAEATAEFHSIFWNAGQQRYGGDPGAIQSLSLPALDIGAPPTAALHSTVVKTLRDDLVTNTNYTLRVGAVTSKILLNILSENGLHETALRTATSTEEPSWGHVSDLLWHCSHGTG